MLSDDGGEFRSRAFRSTLKQFGVRHTLIRVDRPHTSWAVEALHRLILEECWRPAFARQLHVRFTGPKRDLAAYVFKVSRLGDSNRRPPSYHALV
jgi:transposase InsO family protein